MAFFDLLSGVPGYLENLWAQMSQGGTQLPPGNNLPQQAQGLQQAPGTAVPVPPGVPVPINQAPGTTAPAASQEDVPLDKRLEKVLKSAQMMQMLDKEEKQAPVGFLTPAPIQPRQPLPTGTGQVPPPGLGSRSPRTSLRGFM